MKHLQIFKYKFMYMILDFLHTISYVITNCAQGVADICDKTNCKQPVIVKDENIEENLHDIFRLDDNKQKIAKFMDTLHDKYMLERIMFNYPLSPFRKDYQIVAMTLSDKRFVYTKRGDQRKAWNIYLSELQNDDIKRIVDELNAFNVLDKTDRIYHNGKYDEYSARFYYTWEEYIPSDVFLIKENECPDSTIKKLELETL